MSHDLSIRPAPIAGAMPPNLVRRTPRARGAGRRARRGSIALAVCTLTLALSVATGKAQAQATALPAGDSALARLMPPRRSAGSESSSGPTLSSARVGIPAAKARQDTTPHRRRPRAIEYSDWYNRRLTIHRWASYATLPLFVAQYFAGQELLTKRYLAPTWARRLHPALASSIAALFTVNTVTGLWNLWDARSDPAGRVPRTLHGLLMLTADAGFVLVGRVPAAGGITDAARRQHKQRAMVSMSIATLGYLIMLPPFRRN